MPDVPIRARTVGALRPDLKVKAVTSGDPIDFSASGTTNTVFIRNLTTGAWIRQDSATGVTGNDDSTIDFAWTAGDTDTVCNIGVRFKSTDSSGRALWIPPDGLLVGEIVNTYVVLADREVQPS